MQAVSKHLSKKADLSVLFGNDHIPHILQYVQGHQWPTSSFMVYVQ